MPTKDEIVEQVASQMMKCGHPGRVAANKKQRKNFLMQHERQIGWAVDALPRYSAAVAAVVVKCLIKYNDKEKARQFCRALRKNLFNGTDDPVFLLWKFLQKHSGKDTSLVYGRAVNAAKAYMEGRKLDRLYPLKQDVFDWDEGWTVPDDLLQNWHPESVPELD